MFFDVELRGEDYSLSHINIHRTDSSLTNFVPIKYVLTEAAQLNWSSIFMILKCQNTGRVLAKIKWKCSKHHSWIQMDIDGEVPDKFTRVDMYLLERKPMGLLDCIFNDCVALV